MKTSPIGELDYALAWFLFFISATVGGLLAGFFAGLAVGFILGVAGVGMDVIRLTGAVAGFLISMPVSYVVFRVIVGKFIVGKMAEAAATSQATPPYSPPLP